MVRLICSVSLLAFALLLSGCGEPVTHTSLDLSISKLPRATARERQNSLGRIRLAWDFRSDATDDLQRKAERMFVNRYATYARKMKGTETAVEASRLWVRIVREHERRFPGSLGE